MKFFPYLTLNNRRFSISNHMNDILGFKELANSKAPRITSLHNVSIFYKTSSPSSTIHKLSHQRSKFLKEVAKNGGRNIKNEHSSARGKKSYRFSLYRRRRRCNSTIFIVKKNTEIVSIFSGEAGLRTLVMLCMEDNGDGGLGA